MRTTEVAKIVNYIVWYFGTEQFERAALLCEFGRLRQLW